MFVCIIYMMVNMVYIKKNLGKKRNLGDKVVFQEIPLYYLPYSYRYIYSA